MLHKCKYAELIGANAEWIADSEDGRVVCKFCHEPKDAPKPEPVKAPAPKTLRK